MLKQATKWVKEFGKPYKYEDQKTKDKRQLIDGIVNFVVNTIKTIFKLINLMIIVPIKALVTNAKDFTNEYNKIGSNDIDTIVPTFKSAVTGLVQVLTSPLIPIKIIARLILTPVGGVSVFANEGLKKVVDEFFKNTPQPDGKGIKTFAFTKDDDIPERIVSKSKKYCDKQQKDSDKLTKILSKPTLTYYKMKEIRKLIDNESSCKNERAHKPQAATV